MEATHPTRWSRQNLLIDADDTLWENNIYFEHAIASFISFLEHKELNEDQVREVIYRVEHENIKINGYGIASFAKALVRTFEELSVEPITPALHETIQGFARAISEREIEQIENVESTLQDLHTRHRLLLVTKGNFEEQTAKVERSGLKKYFDAVEVVSEKDAQAYSHLADKYKLENRSTWMIGNSPKSDINPALAAGLHAVFLFHKDTWMLEHAEISPAPNGQHLIELDAFAKLSDIF
jgi:putative hydrolase of the HAD superfamily